MQTQKRTSKHTSCVVFSLSLSLSHTHILWIVIKNVITFLTWSRCFHSSAHSLSVSLWSMTSSWRVLPCIPDTEREKKREQVLNVLLFGPRFSISLACPQRHDVAVCFTAIAHPLPDILHRSHTLHSHMLSSLTPLSHAACGHALSLSPHSTRAARLMHISCIYHWLTCLSIFSTFKPDMESWFYVNLKSFLKEFMFLIQLSLAWFNF